jgi:hypothetical protein
MISYKEVSMKGMVLPFREERVPNVIMLASWNEMRL